MKILIADDDPVSRRLLQTYLTRWGHEVVSAVDGAEAWRLFENDPVTLVISDWMMPEVDGLELVRRIRARPGDGYVYTILLSSRAQREDLVQGMEAGADDFITKPFDRDELRVRVQAAERLLRLETMLSEQAGARRQSDAEFHDCVKQCADLLGCWCADSPARQQEAQPVLARARSLIDRLQRSESAG